jgi:hypothetical protein
MFQYKGIKYWLNGSKEWFYRNSLMGEHKPLKATTFAGAKKEVEQKIEIALKNKNNGKVRD